MSEDRARRVACTGSVAVSESWPSKKPFENFLSCASPLIPPRNHWNSKRGVVFLVPFRKNPKTSRSGKRTHNHRTGRLSHFGGCLLHGARHPESGRSPSRLDLEVFVEQIERSSSSVEKKYEKGILVERRLRSPDSREKVLQVITDSVGKGVTPRWGVWRRMEKAFWNQC